MRLFLPIFSSSFLYSCLTNTYVTAGNTCFFYILLQYVRDFSQIDRGSEVWWRFNIFVEPLLMALWCFLEFKPNFYCSANERLFPELEDADITERDRAAAALQSLVDSVKDIRTSDDPLLRAIKSLNKTYRGTKITLNNIFSWYACNKCNVIM